MKTSILMEEPGSSPAISQPSIKRSVAVSLFIVVIDNSPTICKVIEITLRGAGHEVVSFRNGIEAMRWFAGPESRTPNLMLVELDLPKLDGYGIIQKFKAKPRFAHTSCILLSQRARALDPLQGKRAGATAALAKPFSTQELLRAVQAYAIDIN